MATKKKSAKKKADHTDHVLPPLRRVLRAEHMLRVRERAALTALSVWYGAVNRRLDEAGRITHERPPHLLARLEHAATLVGCARADLAQAKRDARRGTR